MARKVRIPVKIYAKTASDNVVQRITLPEERIFVSDKDPPIEKVINDRAILISGAVLSG